uniref:Uncharacterized protein n=1 Tax=Plectus sambesii TaxID=2011161 RepID=A0A914X8G4_9BILA
MALTKLRISWALKLALRNSEPGSVRSSTTWSVSLKYDVADMAALTSQMTPCCYVLDYIISGEVHGVTEGGVLSGFNTGSDHRLIYATLYVIHRL